MTASGARLQDPRQRVKAALIAGVVVLLLIAVLPWFFQGSMDEAPQAASTPAAQLTPWRVIIADLHVDAPLRSIQATNAGTLDPPRNPHDVGWWAQSARPGAATGQTIVTGHTVHSGGGQFDHLANISPGAQIVVASATETVVYRETKVVTLTKTQVDQQAVALFGQRKEPNHLVLITCSGWTGHGYTNNVFVYAVPIKRVPVGNAA